MSIQRARRAAAALHRRAALVAPREAEAVGAVFAELAAAGPLPDAEAWGQRKLDLVGAYGLPGDDPATARKPFAFSGGIAVVPVHGVLLNRISSWGSYATGYNTIRQQAEAAAADADVKRIVLDVNSPGGTVAGCEETGEALLALRGVKPLDAVVDHNAFSAAYWLASAASTITLTPSGMAGSIGCVAMHMSLEGLLEQAGVKVTFMHAGEEKVRGNPFEDLSDADRAGIQAEVDAAYDLFVAAVAEHRGLSEEAVRATEARCFMSAEALAAGLVDFVEAPAAALRRLMAGREEDATAARGRPSRRNSSRTQEIQRMTEKKDQDAAAVAAAAAETARAQAVAEAKTAERKRIHDIQNCDEAKGRGKLASHLATETEMDAASARKVLAAAAVEMPPAAAGQNDGGKDAAGNPFERAMGATGNPNIGPDGKPGGTGAGGQDEEQPGARGARAVAAIRGKPRAA